MAYGENWWRNQARDWRDQDRWRDEGRHGRMYEERDYAGPLRGNQFRNEDRGYGQGFGRGGFSSMGQRDYGQRDYGRRDDDMIDYAEARRDWYRDSDRDNLFGEGGYRASRGRSGGYDDRSRGHRGDYQGGNDRGFFERAGDEMASWFGDEDAERRRRQDALRGDSMAQHHRGRGPRGYTRSDDRIREDVNDRLTDDPYIDASEIDVSVSNGEITLSGTVNDRNTKRRAEDLAEAISGVRHVQNNLRVQQQNQQGGLGGSTSAGASAMAGMGSSSTGPTGTTGTTGDAGSTTNFGNRVTNRT